MRRPTGEFSDGVSTPAKYSFNAFSYLRALHKYRNPSDMETFPLSATLSLRAIKNESKKGRNGAKNGEALSFLGSFAHVFKAEDFPMCKIMCNLKNALDFRPCRKISLEFPLFVYETNRGVADSFRKRIYYPIPLLNFSRPSVIASAPRAQPQSSHRLGDAPSLLASLSTDTRSRLR